MITPDFSFHHVGVACVDIDAEVLQMTALGYAIEGAPFRDPVQGVRGVFVVNGPRSRLELLQPLTDAPGGALAPWLRDGIKLYHLAYVVEGLASAIESMRGRRAKLVVPPTPAVAFDQREIAFVMMPNRLLIELISAR